MYSPAKSIYNNVLLSIDITDLKFKIVEVANNVAFLAFKLDW